MTVAQALLRYLDAVATDAAAAEDTRRAADYVRQGVVRLIDTGHVEEALRDQVLAFLDELLNGDPKPSWTDLWLRSVRAFRATVASLPIGEADEPCGSWRITETVEGMAYRVAWCPRRTGSCPFRGTTEAKGSTYKCADSPGRRLAVVYSDDTVIAARRVLRRYVDGGTATGPMEEAVYVGISAIDACLGTEGGPGDKEEGR